MPSERSRRPAAKADQFEPLVARQLDVLHDAFAPHQIDAELRRAHRRARGRGRDDVQHVPRRDRRPARRRQRDRRHAAHEQRLRRRAERHGKRRSRSAPRSPTASASSRDSATKRHAASATATTSPSPSPPASSTRSGCSPPSTTSTRRPRRPSTSGRRASTPPSSERFGCDPADLRPWHLDDPFFQDPPISGAVDLDPLFEHADLEALTVRSYDGLGLDIRPVLAAQRPVRARRQEPARLLHRRRPRG